MTTATTTPTPATTTASHRFTWLDSADFRLVALRKMFANGTSRDTEFGPAFLQMMDLLAEELQFARKELEDARTAQEKRE